jgi:hypothetical protein
MRYAFTGPSKLAEADRKSVRETLQALARDRPAPTHITTGGARGVDVLVAELALGLWPFAKHRVIVPDAPYDREAVAWLEISGAEIVRAPTAVSPAGAYRIRNEAMLVPHDDTTLFAFLRSLDFYRSGEWMTVNIAKKAGLPVFKFTLG